MGNNEETHKNIQLMKLFDACVPIIIISKMVSQMHCIVVFSGKRMSIILQALSPKPTLSNTSKPRIYEV
jgi:hypothetical protein